MVQQCTFKLWRWEGYYQSVAFFEFGTRCFQRCIITQRQGRKRIWFINAEKLSFVSSKVCDYRLSTYMRRTSSPQCRLHIRKCHRNRGRTAWGLQLRFTITDNCLAAVESPFYLSTGTAPDFVRNSTYKRTSLVYIHLLKNDCYSYNLCILITFYTPFLVESPQEYNRTGQNLNSICQTRKFTDAILYVPGLRLHIPVTCACFCAIT